MILTHSKTVKIVYTLMQFNSVTVCTTQACFSAFFQLILCPYSG